LVTSEGCVEKSIAYQAFIDLLTLHGKTTSSAFLQLYSSVSEAPDPYPLLEASVDSLLVSEETLPRLTSENQHLQRTVAKLTAQLEQTEEQLERERQTRKTVEETREAKVKEIEASWTAVLKEKQENWEAKEHSLEEKVENQERLLREVKASYEVSQRLGRAEEADGVNAQSSATAAELEVVSLDLDRTSLRLAEMEARNEQLRLQLAQSASLSQPAQAVEADPVFLRLQTENSSLLRRIENAKFDRESREIELQSKTRSLEREITKLGSDKETLREKIQKWADYEDVKRELEVLKVSYGSLAELYLVYLGIFTDDGLPSQSSLPLATRTTSIQSSIAMHLTTLSTKAQRKPVRPVQKRHWSSYSWQETRSSPTN